MLITGIFFLAGLLAGSFFNAFIYRAPRSMNFVTGRSICTACKTVLAPKDLVPVGSYLFLRGRCRYCKTRISPRYPLIETAAGFLFALAGWQYGLSLQTAFMLVFWSMLLVIAMIDLDQMVIMDATLWFLAISGGVLRFFSGWKGWDHLWGALAGLGFYAAIYWIAKWLYKREVFGWGDVLLLGTVGFLTGLEGAVLIGFLAFYFALIGVLLKKLFRKKVSMKEEVPFGPYICLAAFCFSLFEKQILSWFYHFVLLR